MTEKVIMKKKFQSGAWIKCNALLATLMVAFVVSACGGAGAGAGGTGAAGGAGDTDGLLNEQLPVDDSGTPPVARVSLLTSAPSLGSDGKQSATLTALVTGAGNVAVAGKPVTFVTKNNEGTTEDGVVLEITNGITDASGRATAELTLSKRNLRTVTVEAQSGAFKSETTIEVVGTVVQINGSDTLLFNTPSEFSIALRDSAGAPVSNAPFTVTSAAGNLVTYGKNTRGEDIRTTDTQGQARFFVSGGAAGQDTITVTSDGARATLAVAVSSTQLSFESPAPGTGTPEVNVNTDSQVAVRLIQGGLPLANRPVQFSSTRGTFTTPVSVSTDPSGIARATIRSTSAGLSTITATAELAGTGVTVVNRQIEFVSTIPASLEVQASPPVIGANISATGTKSSQLIAKVRDINDNPVKGVRVNFNAVNDPSGGRIEPGFGMTDSQGVATASFIAGPNATGFQAVEVQGTIPAPNTVAASSTRLTVSELELSVRIGTGREILQPPGNTLNAMPWTAIVADSGQNPVANASVVVALETLRYRKGRFVPGTSAWVQDYSPSGPNHCPSEDVNRNRLLDQGEDTDSDGQLDPGSVAVAVVTSPNSRTDANGQAEIEIRYTKDIAMWVEARLVVTITTVNGTESSAEQTFWLPGVATDYDTITRSPPGANAPVGPFGENGSCASPN